MKRIYYLLALAVATVFSACNPLDKTYKDLGNLPAPHAPATSVTLTLSANDYGLLPKGNSAQKAQYFKSADSAKVGIPLILAAKYPTYGEKSSATVTFALMPPKVTPVDSLITNISYTATNADYISILGASPKYIELTSAQAATLLTNKYPNAVNNQEVMLTYQFYESGVVSTITTTTDTFVFINGAWVKCYTITPALFLTVGNVYGDFSSSDAPLINTYLAAILKADLGTTAKAKVGDVKYVAYKYYASKNYQRIQPMIFDGTNWTANSLPQTIVFAKTNGIWVADNTINYKLVQADYTAIASGGPVGSADAKTNISQHPDFNISATTDATYWSAADIQTSLDYWVNFKYGATAVKDQKFNITYTTYNKGALTDITLNYTYDGSAFVLKK